MSAQRYEAMARSVWGKPFSDWPGWSTGETLTVALLLNNHAALDAMSYTMVEAFDRVDVSATELRAIERRLQS